MQSFFRWEDSGSDFPYYRGSPTALSYLQWWLVLAAAAAAFIALALTASIAGAGLFLPFLPAIGLAAIPLLALWRVAPGHWGSLFGKVGGRELRLMLGFALLNIVISMGLGAVVMSIGHTSSNASTLQLGALDALGLIAFFAKTIPNCSARNF